VKRLIGWLLLLGLGAGAVAILLTAFPVYALLIIWGGGGVALWWSVSRTPNPASPEREPVPSPTNLGPEDYVSADGARVYRKRAVGYSVEQLKAPADADTSPGRAD
jgi:hypothetical protein